MREGGDEPEVKPFLGVLSEHNATRQNLLRIRQPFCN